MRAWTTEMYGHIEGHGPLWEMKIESLAVPVPILVEKAGAARGSGGGQAALVSCELDGTIAFTNELLNGSC